MIKIERDNLDGIASDYYRLIKRKKSRFNKKRNCSVQKYWVDHHERIIKSRDLETLNEEFESMNHSKCEVFKTYMEGQYEFIRDNIAYWLMNRLGVRVCPYCNRQFTFTIEDEKIRPQFDHYYPQCSHPWLSISFYNLIPSCPTCNLKKGSNLIELNPYIEGFEDNHKFQIKSKDENNLDWLLEKNFDVVFSPSNLNIDTLGLKKLYNEHKDYIEEIIDKAQAYHHDYYAPLIDSFRGLGKQEGDIDRFIWGNYLDRAEHEKRPLSKLTKDILEQLEIKRR